MENKHNISINMNGLHLPIKRERFSNRLIKQYPAVGSTTETHLKERNVKRSKRKDKEMTGKQKPSDSRG